MSTWSVRLYDPNQVAGFQLNVSLVVPLGPPIEGRNVYHIHRVHIALPYDCALANRFLWAKFYLQLSDGKLATYKMIRSQRL